MIKNVKNKYLKQILIFLLICFKDNLVHYIYSSYGNCISHAKFDVEVKYKCIYKCETTNDQNVLLNYISNIKALSSNIIDVNTLRFLQQLNLIKFGD